MCRIQCGDGLYRVQNYCYYAEADGVLNCVEGNSKGICTKCKDGYYLRNNACNECGDGFSSSGGTFCFAINNQDVLDAIASAIGNGCVAPQLYTCESTCSGSDKCGTFDIEFSDWKVKKMVLNGNALGTIPTEVLYLEHLLELDVSSNNFASVPTEIYALPSLTALSMAHSECLCFFT